MKKTFEFPNVEIIEIEDKDIITTSGGETFDFFGLFRYDEEADEWY